uniref:Tigerinin-4O n=1 Tax=Hoplobatrachus occipitalis TaxID=127645 RepID=TIN4O_HOPOC|nr:RecName: Full=Tigerinin-4O [Hoplobatrachus occipitalis]
RTCIPIPPVCF